MSRERRKSARLYIGVEGEYRRNTQPDNKARVLIQDISITGVRFIAGEALRDNDELTFLLHLPNMAMPINARGKVVWQKRFSESFFDTGIEFLDISPESKNNLSDYIKNALERVAENREFIRCNLCTMIHFSYIDDVIEEQRGITVDVSPTGLKILVRHALQKGQRLKVHFNLPDMEAAVTGQAQVIWSRINSDNFCESGIEFTEIDIACVDLINDYIRRTLGIDW